MDEVWKPLMYGDLDLTDRFEISNFGELRNIKSQKILKTVINKKGYKVVCVSLGRRHQNKLLRIHRCVAYMFVDGYEDGLFVNHKDGNKLNNEFTNLEWVTNKENSQHASQNGLLKHCKPIICEQTGEIFVSMENARRWCGLKTSNSLGEYFNSNHRKTAGKHPITGEPLTWHYL